jgi:hypothetical protein
MQREQPRPLVYVRNKRGYGSVTWPIFDSMSEESGDVAEEEVTGEVQTMTAGNSDTHSLLHLDAENLLKDPPTAIHPKDHE